MRKKYLINEHYFLFMNSIKCNVYYKENNVNEWLEIIYPESKKDLIPWIEAVWFATGTEFRITEEPVEEDEVDDAIQFWAYTDLWRDKDIKDWLCKEIGCSPEELVVRKISGQHHYVKYDYEEI